MGRDRAIDLPVPPIGVFGLRVHAKDADDRHRLERGRERKIRPRLTKPVTREQSRELGIGVGSVDDRDIERDHSAVREPRDELHVASRGETGPQTSTSVA